MYILDAAATFCEDTVAIWKLIGLVINILKIAIPIIIVLMAMIDLGKAVMAGEDKEIKAAQKMLIKRLIYGVVIFFVVTLVQAAFGLVGKNFDSDLCWTCATNPNNAKCENGIVK